MKPWLTEATVSAILENPPVHELKVCWSMGENILASRETSQPCMDEHFKVVVPPGVKCPGKGFGEELYCLK